ncbi:MULTISPECIES: NAD-dependent epimerase/dehydratase family protein [unclassified Exiguobacterium]|uniref:NAD-dependent epimerase/dehydratase family protein n=1 Tax=unclassified Exiguobacterium TaxID=2644629 RepID=UPI001BE8662A|nr:MULTISPECIES: NAD-dependent epimerase/dehydratase family protein [unclassified Exiguobacterium]
MKNIILTGSKGYLSTSLKEFFNKQVNQFYAKTISLRNNEWEKIDFSNTDVVIHCAALVHKNEQKYKLEDYMKVNSDLTLELAKKSKREGVKHFIFFSTMSVYGVEEGPISIDTQTNPKTFYGQSKLKAENLLLELASKDFTVSVLRPPMIYGNSSPGNYRKLSYLSKKIIFFPNINNKRSMIFVKNLEIYVKEIVLRRASGIYLPQNNEYVSTINLVKEIRNNQRKHTISFKLLNPLIMFFSKKNSSLNKLFGDLYYKEDTDQLNIKNKMYDFKESIRITEVGLSKNYE